MKRLQFLFFSRKKNKIKQSEPDIPLETCEAEISPHGTSDDECFRPENEIDQCEETNASEFTSLEPYISLKLIKLGIFGVQVGAFCRVHHYYFKKHAIRASMRKCWLSTLGWWTAVTMATIQLIFMVAQSLRYSFGPEKAKVSDDQKVLLMFGVVFLTLSIVFLMAFRYEGDELTGYWNQTLTFFESYLQVYGKPKTTREKLLELRVSEMYTEWFFGSIAAAAVVFNGFTAAMPHTKIFFSCLSVDPTAFYHLPLRIFSVAIMMYNVYVYAAGAYVYGTGFTSFLPYVALMSNFRTVGVLKQVDPRQLLLTYRELQLLYDKVNRSCATLVFPAVQYILLACTIFGMYGSIRFEGWLLYSLAVTGLVCGNILFVVFWTLARVQLVNSRLLSDWKRHAVLSRRELKTLRPIKIMVGEYGFVDQGLLLTMVDIIASNLITLLLTS